MGNQLITTRIKRTNMYNCSKLHTREDTIRLFQICSVMVAETFVPYTQLLLHRNLHARRG